MSTEIKPATGRGDRFNSSRKAELLNKIEGIPDDINFAIFIEENEGIISVSEDKTIRVWLKRDSGTYWPSIVNFMPSQCSSVEYVPETRTLFVGQENGTISQFLLSEDCNRLSPIKEYLAHNGRITQLIFAKNSGWILSCARDKTFAAHCIETSNKIGGYTFEAWCTSMQFDSLSKHVFVGDYAGQITMLKLQQSGASLVTILKGHTASVRSLHWSDGPQLLFSGSADNSVIVWDLGERRGTTYELQGHQNKVSALGYVKNTQELISNTAMKAFIEANFKIMDINSDGVIGVDEFRYNAIQRLATNNIKIIDDAFNALLNEKDKAEGGLTLSRYQELYGDFLGKQDFNPAVFLFGPLAVED